MEQTLSRRAASDAISDQGWRYLLGALRTSVPVGSLVQAADVAARVVAACGSDADGHLRADIRPDRVVLTLQSMDQAALTALRYRPCASDFRRHADRRATDGA